MTLLGLSGGVIREGRAVVSGRCEGDGFDYIDILATGPGGQELRRARLADCVTAAGTAGFDAAFALGGLDGPVKAVAFASPDPAFRLEAAAAYELTCLFFETEEEYARSGFGVKRASRPRDKETDAFLSRQLAEAYGGALEDRILMTVAYAYRAVEIGATAEIAGALDLLAAREGETGTLGPSHQFRRDRTHLRVSLGTARWHGELALGRAAALRATLAGLMELAPHVMISQQVFRTCGNMIRGLALLAALALRRGERDLAFEALRTAREVLRFAGQRIEDEPAVLQEFGGICRLCAGMTPLRKTLGRDPAAVFDPAELEARLVRPAIRSSNVEAMLEAFRRAVEAFGQSRIGEGEVT